MRLVLVTELSAGVGMGELSNRSKHSPGVDGPMAWSDTAAGNTE